MEQRFIDKIEDLRHHTYSRITELQKNLCPMEKNIYMNYQFEYWFEGYRYPIWEDNVHLYAVNEIPYCYDNETKNTTFIDTLDSLVMQDKVWPFLLFINGVAIRWSKITVIHDYNYSYLKINDFAPDESFYAKIVVFPIPSKLIRYGEDRNVLVNPDRKGFYFGTNGKRLETTDFVDIILRFEILDENVYYKEVNLSNMTGNTLTFNDLPDGYIPTLDNILTFSADGSYNSLGPSKKIEDIYNGTYGMFNVLQNDFDVKWAILMYNTSRVSKEESFIYSKAEDLNRDAIVNLLTSTPKTSTEIWDDIITPLIKVFDFDHEFGTNYETNLYNAAKYITRYDFRLWKDIFTKNVSIKSLTYTGLEFKNLATEQGYVNYSRAHGELIQDVLIAFINHKLYKYMPDVTYDTNSIRVPIFGILDDDHVEIMMFTQSNNNILDIVIPNATTEVYIHPEYNLNDCHIMTDECVDAVYPNTPSAEGRLQYIIDEYTYEYDASKSTYKITFTHPEYYNKKLKVVPKKQFRYYRFKQIEGQHKFILPTQFNYCHDPDRYLVFVNGKKIDRTEYTITIMNKDRPFDKLVLYISTIMDAGDYVDVFYIPEQMVEKYKQNEIPKSGLLVLEDTDEHINYPTTYPLSKYTSLVFINGLKVNPLDIKDVSLNAMLIGVDKYLRDKAGNPTGINPHQADSIDNITIMEYVEGNKEIAGYLKGLYEQIPEGDPYDPSKINFNKPASDDWKDLIETLLNKYAEEGVQYAGLKKIFGSIFEIENPAADYKDNFADLRSVLYDTVVDYYLNRSEVTTGDKFVYDFERKHFDPDVTPDDPSVVKDIKMYPDKDKLCDYQFTDNIAEEPDVMEGQKFYSADE